MWRTGFLPNFVRRFYIIKAIAFGDVVPLTPTLLYNFRWDKISEPMRLDEVLLLTITHPMDFSGG